MQLSPAETLDLLAAAAPTFVHEDWEETERLAYVEVGDLVYHLRAGLKLGEPAEVVAVMEVVEALLAGNRADENFVQIGLFESIQNTSSGTGLDQEAWEPFLGPLSRRLWDELNDMWGGSTTPSTP